MVQICKHNIIIFLQNTLQPKFDRILQQKHYEIESAPEILSEQVPISHFLKHSDKPNGDGIFISKIFLRLFFRD